MSMERTEKREFGAILFTFPLRQCEVVFVVVCGEKRKRSRLLYKRESILGFQCLVQCAIATWREESGLFWEPDANGLD